MTNICYQVKRIVVIILMLYCVKVNVYSAGAGSSSMSTLLLPVSARISALGEACVSLDNDITVLNRNPAGITGMKGWDTSLMYQRGFADDDYMNIHIGKEYKGMMLATSILYYSTGDIELYKSNGTKVTEVGKRDIIWSVGAARKIWIMPVGLNLKYISSELFGKKATAYAFDAGTQYKFSKQINVGLSVKNMGTKIKYLSKEESLPAAIQAGGNYRKDYKDCRLLVIDDIEYKIKEKEYLNKTGVELEYLGRYYVRAGCLLNLRERKDRSVDIGIGYKHKKHMIDYSVELKEGLNIPQRVTFGYKF